MKAGIPARPLAICVVLLTAFGCSVGCSRTGDASHSKSDTEPTTPDLRKLQKPDLEKLRLEVKNEEVVVYNGTDWYLTSADIQVSAQTTNELREATRRFRLYPQGGHSGGQQVIKPYTSSAVDWSDLSTWMEGKDLKQRIFVEAEGYKK